MKANGRQSLKRLIKDNEKAKKEKKEKQKTSHAKLEAWRNLPQDQWTEARKKANGIPIEEAVPATEVTPNEEQQL